MRTAFKWLALVALAVTMLSELTWQKRKVANEIRDAIDAPDRFIDLGVELRTVVADPAGTELVEGAPPLRVVQVRRFGGMLDTGVTPPRIVGPSRAPRVWYASEEQTTILMHDGRPRGQLVDGSEGAGKTTTLAQWHYFQWLRRIGERREGLQTAPTMLRLGLVKREIEKLWNPHWYRYVARKDFEGFELVDGCSLRMVSTHRQSEAAGSRVQGFNSSWAGRDELQDQADVDADIENRGRAAKGGGVEYDQLVTATAKDHPDWRSLRGAKLASGCWVRRTLFVRRSPFISPAFIEAKKSTMTDREFRRRIEGEDVGVELAVYYGWLRSRNVVPRPQIATDVTGAVLAGYRSYVKPSARFSLLVGHDPGNIWNTSVVLRLLMFGDVPTWVVVGEYQSHQTTADTHAQGLLAYLQAAFGVETRVPERVNGRPTGRMVVSDDTSKVACFIDPHGKGEAQTDYQTVYMAFQAVGLDAFNPAPMTGRIKRAARVGMTNRLLYDANRCTRLVVACDELGRPVAPVLVSAFETLEKKPGDDNPEGTRSKDKSDQTHAPAACSYCLWPFEQEAFTDATVARARAEARRVG